LLAIKVALAFVFIYGHGRNTWWNFDWNIFCIVALPSIQDPSSPFNRMGWMPRDGLESMAELDESLNDQTAQLALFDFGWEQMREKTMRIQSQYLGYLSRGRPVSPHFAQEVDEYAWIELEEEYIAHLDRSGTSEVP
jgi:hypothetical protein